MYFGCALDAKLNVKIMVTLLDISSKVIQWKQICLPKRSIEAMFVLLPIGKEEV